MKNFIKFRILWLVAFAPTILLAQPTEYVQDTKTKTVTPINEKPVLENKAEVIISNTPSPVPAPEIIKSEPATAPIEQPIQVTAKSVSEVEEFIAVMRFESKLKDFGTVKMGEHPTHTFYFKNTGLEPTEIEIATTCDCTSLDYSRQPIPVGGRGFIKATFMSERAPEAVNGHFNKEITIILKNKYADTGYPIVETLKIQGAIVE